MTQPYVGLRSWCSAAPSIIKNYAFCNGQTDEHQRQPDSLQPHRHHLWGRRVNTFALPNPAIAGHGPHKAWGSFRPT